MPMMIFQASEPADFFEAMRTSVAHETARGKVYGEVSSTFLSLRRHRFPVHGEHIIAQAPADGVDVKGGVGKHGACHTPAHAWTVRRPAGSPIPSLVGGLKQFVDGLAGHVAVDEDFGQALGNIGRARHIKRVPRQGECPRTMGIEQQPGRAPAELIAGALHKDCLLYTSDAADDCCRV